MRQFLAFVTCLLFATSVTASEPLSKPRLLLDADTANEIDDLFAIVRMLKQDKFEVVALTSSQWFHYLAAGYNEPGETTVDASQRYNEELLAVLGREDIPMYKGSVEPIGKPWGGFEPKDSPAAQAIIRHARETPEGKKLIVVCLGASTNLASAIGLAPDIVPRIEAHLLGFRYDFDAGVWDKSSFNVRRDLNAADLLLNTEGLDLHIMPANVAKPLYFGRDRSWERHEQMGELGAYLTGKWKIRSATTDIRIMWDVALIQALIHPEWATVIQAPTPPENTPRTVTLYREIDADAMRDDYWNTVLP